MLFAGPYVAAVFIKQEDADLLRTSITAIKIFSFSYLTGWIDMCFSSYFTAIDRLVRSFVVSLFSTLVFPIAFLFALTAIWGLNGVWLMAFVSATASSILTLVLAKALKMSKIECIDD